MVLFNRPLRSQFWAWKSVILTRIRPRYTVECSAEKPEITWRVSLLQSTVLNQVQGKEHSALHTNTQRTYSVLGRIVQDVILSPTVKGDEHQVVTVVSSHNRSDKQHYLFQVCQGDWLGCGRVSSKLDAVPLYQTLGISDVKFQSNSSKKKTLKCYT